MTYNFEANIKNDPFFKEDELISSIKMNDHEKTNWRRIKAKGNVLTF